MKAYLAILFTTLFLASCTCCEVGPESIGDDLAPQPGGDCVLNLNPDGNGFGPTFLIAYDLDGSAGTSTHMVKIGSNDESLTVGALSGTRVDLEMGHTYDLIIEDMEGPTVRLVDKTVTTNPDLFPSVTNITGADVKAGTFGVVPRGLESGGVAYSTIAIVAEVSGGGTKGVKFSVNETVASP